MTKCVYGTGELHIVTLSKLQNSQKDENDKMLIQPKLAQPPAPRFSPYSGLPYHIPAAD